MAARDYEDFDLLVEGLPDGRYRARVLAGPTGPTPAVEFALPFEQTVLENLLLKLDPGRSGTRRGTANPQVTAARDFGSPLFDAVFSGVVGQAWATARTAVGGHGRGLRLRLHLAEAPAIASLPWELLHDKSTNSYIAQSERTPIVRYLDVPDTLDPLPLDGPLSVLVVISSPSDLPELDVGAEWGRVTEALEEKTAAGLVRLRQLEEPTVSALGRHLRREDVHVLHFVGHGDYDASIEDGVLYFCDGYGRSSPVTASVLGPYVHDHDPLRLVVLNACRSASVDSDDPFGGMAQGLVQQNASAVVAMQFPITDRAAVTFTGELYGALADGLPVDQAVASSRKALAADFGAEWATPVLFLRSDDTQLFTELVAAPPAEVAPPAPPPPAADPAPTPPPVPPVLPVPVMTPSPGPAEPAAPPATDVERTAAAEPSAEPVATVEAAATAEAPSSEERSAGPPTVVLPPVPPTPPTPDPDPVPGPDDDDHEQPPNRRLLAAVGGGVVAALLAGGVWLATSGGEDPDDGRSASSTTPAPTETATTPSPTPTGSDTPTPTPTPKDRTGPALTAVRFATPPRIDGSADDWDGAKVVDVRTRIAGSKAVAGFGARVRLGWDAENYYVVAEVSDAQVTQTHAAKPSQLFNGDSIGFEIGSDVVTTKQAALFPDDSHVLVGPTEEGGILAARNVARGSAYEAGGVLQGIFGLAFVDGGYVLEAAIPWTELGLPSPDPGTTLATNLTVSDAVASGDSRGKLAAMLSNNPARKNNGAPFRHLYGTVTLTD
ncbi:CHAT domain-containing protein [Oryzobacter sp. R7]|uniref:CHAT domain-containing protein n=1 Tax=Oryzobacter faecalis TaxID=3388656 RepID=UPI00398D2952